MDGSSVASYMSEWVDIQYEMYLDCSCSVLVHDDMFSYLPSSHVSKPVGDFIYVHTRVYNVAWPTSCFLPHLLHAELHNGGGQPRARTCADVRVRHCGGCAASEGKLL